MFPVLLGLEHVTVKEGMKNIQSHKKGNSACRLQESIQYVEEHEFNVILHVKLEVKHLVFKFYTSTLQRVINNNRIQVTRQ
jgi:hypothetical protein